MELIILLFVVSFPTSVVQLQRDRVYLFLFYESSIFLVCNEATTEPLHNRNIGGKPRLRGCPYLKGYPPTFAILRNAAHQMLLRLSYALKRHGYSDYKYELAAMFSAKNTRRVTPSLA